MSDDKNYIKPRLLKYTYFERFRLHFDQMRFRTAFGQIVLLIISLLILEFFPTIGKIVLIYMIFAIVYYHSVIYIKIERTRRKHNSSLSDEADKLCLKMIDIIDKSTTLAVEGLPKQVNQIQNTLVQIKFEFNDNALVPFWDEVENFVLQMNSFEESLKMLKKNKYIFYKVIQSTENNFPNSFPVSTDINFPEQIFSDFKFIQRQAYKRFEFANLWEQRKSQKIMAFGFSNLKGAIDNMSQSVVSALNELNLTTQQGFETLSSNIRSMEFNNSQDLSETNKILTSNLKSIDDKLYFIQYNRKPNEPFRDI